MDEDDDAARSTGTLLGVRWIPGVAIKARGSDRFARFLDPVFAQGEAQVLLEQGKAEHWPREKRRRAHQPDGNFADVLIGRGSGIGMVHGFRSYANADKGYTEPDAVAAPLVYNTLLNKYYVDEGYDYLFTGRRKVGDVRLGVMGLGEASSWFDSNVIDGAVNAAGWITRSTATFSSWWDKWIIDGIGVNGPAIFGAHAELSCAVVRMGPGAVVCPGDDGGAARVRFLLRVSLRQLLAVSS